MLSPFSVWSYFIGVLCGLILGYAIILFVDWLTKEKDKK